MNQNNTSPNKEYPKYRSLTLLVFVVALSLRLLLCWGNPADNAFDDHFTPIAMIVQTGEVPAKNACWQCYQPPVFYYSSAIVAKALIVLGVTDNNVINKSLQFLNCVYVILTLIISYLILKRLHFSEVSRLLAFGIICFLPRHIFMSAMHSNDSLSYLGVSLCTYLLLVTIDRKLSWPFAGLLGITVTLAIFVKYTAFIVLPMVSIPLVSLAFVKSGIPRSRIMGALVVVLLVPLLLLGNYMVHNYRDYGRALPWNDSINNTAAVHPHDPEGISFASFTPWQYIAEPIVMPGHMHSFWTMIYSGMWVDNEPKFTNFTDDKHSLWWKQYFAWVRGETFFPLSPVPISTYTRVITAGLLIFGMLPILLSISGFIRCIRTTFSIQTIETIKLQIFPLMLCFNAIGIMYLVLKAPVYSSIKASYFLNSLPAFSVCMALGIQSLEKRIWITRMVSMVSCAIVGLTSLYVIRIFLAL